jgi:glycine cleavage system H protein
MSASTEIKTDRFYTREHEWAKMDDAEVRVGITAFAVDQLGDITLVDLNVAVGDVLTVGQVFGSVESVKTLSDLFSPVSGKVLRINQDLINRPETLNEDCWNASWIIAVEPDSPLQKSEHLLDAAEYGIHVENTQH